MPTQTETPDTAQRKMQTTSGMKLTPFATKFGTEHIPVKTAVGIETKDTTLNTLNQSIDKLNVAIANLSKGMVELLRRAYPNWIQPYTLTATSRTKLSFLQDTANLPVYQIYVLAIGGGLQLWLNGSDPIFFGTNDQISGEFRSIEYQVTSGQAVILLFTRIDK